MKKYYVNGYKPAYEEACIKCGAKWLIWASTNDEPAYCPYCGEWQDPDNPDLHPPEIENFRHIVRNTRTGEYQFYPCGNPLEVGETVQIQGKPGIDPADDWEVVRAPDSEQFFEEDSWKDD